MSTSRKRILVFAEAVTLAHVARPLAFAGALARDKYDVMIAVAPHAARHVVEAGVAHVPLSSIAPEAFLQALAAGRPLYDADTLSAYVEDDLRWIREFAPDLVVGDFRLSLSVSARVAEVPYATIASAYWSPFYDPPDWPVPALPLTRIVPLPIARRLFSAARPMAFRLHCRPLNAVRKRYGLAPLAADLRRIYTDADHVLYSDLPALFPLKAAPASHRFLGPVLWQPSVPLPEWWDTLPDDRPIVYVTLGSSGERTLLAHVVDALAGLPIIVIAATVASAAGSALRDNVFVADYLPGISAARRAALVVCNGGSLTGYQALSAGVPVLGIAGNLDQFLNMQGIELAGAGALMRADRWSRQELKRTAERLLSAPEARGAARSLRAQCEQHEFTQRAAEFVVERCSRH